MQSPFDLTDFQIRCLEAFESRKDVLAIAPSSAGKTYITERFVSEYFRANYGKFLKSPRRMKVAFILPYKALAVQEYNRFQTMVEHQGIKVLLAVGGVGVKEEEIAEANIIVGTYEKVLALMKYHPILTKYLKLLIIDEFHFLGTERGVVIEELILEWKRKSSEAQLILLSSSISNPIEIADWLNVTPIIEVKRPIPLDYSVEVSADTLKYVNKLKETSEQILIFSQSRSVAEKLAEKIAEKRDKESDLDLEQVLAFATENIEDTNIMKTIKNAYFPPLLKKVVQHRTAYHHAGLNDIVRILIEEMYRSGEIDVLVSTSTLAAGINLPADLSIYTIKNNRIKTENNLVFQTLGRAGRLGYRDKGKGVVLVPNERLRSKTEKQLFEKDGNEKVKPIFQSIKSKMGDYDFLIKYYLESIKFNEEPYSSQMIHLLDFLEDSLWFYQKRTKLQRHIVDFEILNALFSSVDSKLETKEILEFYRRFDKTRDIKERKMTIQSIEGINQAAVVANIKEMSKLYQIYLSPSRRSCTCQNKHSNFICKHQRYLLQQYPKAQERWLNSYGLIDFLMKEGFIVRSSGNRINLTYMGQLASGYFIHPYDFLDYLEYCSSNKEITITQYLQQFITRDKKIKQEIKANELSSLQAIKLAQDIVTGREIRDMCVKYNISDSFISEWRESIFRFMKMFQALNFFIGKQKEAEKISEWIDKSKGLIEIEMFNISEREGNHAQT
ncbi:MAG: DEAD/DEAH box helicase [Candidatus Heimdallarchaeota archaeon]|nr:DEAD/DEAH box helicase [Candidatus Heimdallarchaeota archaeon]